jgi:hypothetical protein
MGELKMSQVDYKAMSAPELRRYWLANKADKQALDAYLERRTTRLEVSTFHPDDADFEVRMMALVQRQLQLSPSEIN